jgi:hypothetical protein
MMRKVQFYGARNMQDILWIMAIANMVYLAFALRKNSTKIVSSVADRVRVLDVPENMLSAQPVPKKVTIKEQAVQSDNWWESKIQGFQGRVSRRKDLEPEQMLLSDLDDTLS